MNHHDMDNSWKNVRMETIHIVVILLVFLVLRESQVLVGFFPSFVYLCSTCVSSCSSCIPWHYLHDHHHSLLLESSESFFSIFSLLLLLLLLTSLIIIRWDLCSPTTFPSKCYLVQLFATEYFHYTFNALKVLVNIHVSSHCLLYAKMIILCLDMSCTVVCFHTTFSFTFLSSQHHTYPDDEEMNGCLIDVFCLCFACLLHASRHLFNTSYFSMPMANKLTWLACFVLLTPLRFNIYFRHLVSSGASSWPIMHTKHCICKPFWGYMRVHTLFRTRIQQPDLIVWNASEKQSNFRLLPLTRHI